MKPVRRLCLSLLSLLCLAPAVWAQSELPAWTGVHRLDIVAWHPIDSTQKSTAEMTLRPDPGMHMDPVSSLCGLELHGNSNLSAPKKSFALEVRGADGEEQKLSLLGMAPGDDYVLLSCYFDRSFLRNVLTFELWRSLGHYAPHYRFCELYLNGAYQGLYLLTERIKVDPGRMQLGTPPIAHSLDKWASPPFLLRLDWKDEKSRGLGKNLSGAYLHYRLEYPKPEKAGGVSHLFQRFLNELDRRFHQAFEGPETDYTDLIDLASFADFFVVNELAKNPDGLKTSAYFYRQHATELDPKPRLMAGPVWDFDLAYDNVRYARHHETGGWAYAQHGAMSNAQLLPVWWHVLGCNPEFRAFCQARTRLLEKELASGQMEAYLRMLSFNLGPAMARDAQQWNASRTDFTNDLGPVLRGASEDLARILSFLPQRAEWMEKDLATDNCFSPLAAQRAVKASLEVRTSADTLLLDIWTDSLQPDFHMILRCSIIDSRGQRVREDWEWSTSGEGLKLATADWPPGEYFLELLPAEDWMMDPLIVSGPVTSYAPNPVATSAPPVWIPVPMSAHQPLISTVPQPVGSHTQNFVPYGVPLHYRFLHAHRYVTIVVE